MEDILAITLIFGSGAAFLLSLSPIGRAIADRIRRGSKGIDSHEISELRDAQVMLLEEMEGLRNELSDVREQLDFTERIIARQRTEGALPKGADDDA
jgi:hypothetical protein